MKSIVFLCPYFGKLPKKQFELWLKSCGFNPSIDWIIYTDDNIELDVPKNVFIKKMTFQSFCDRIQSKFSFKINVLNPYKLCDFKPTYGYILSDDIKNYDFWGHCDLSDCIFGNLRNFLTEQILMSADKILFLGHMTIYKNDDDVNQRFFLSTKQNVPLEIILNGSNKAFDELNPISINTIYKEHHFKIQRLDLMYADVTPLKFAFVKSCYDPLYNQYYCKKKPLVFEWREGGLFEYMVEGSELVKREIGYVHFQKRAMKKLGDSSKNRFIIRPNVFDFESNDFLSVESVMKFSKDRLFYLPFFKLKLKSLKYRIRKLFLGKTL